MPNACVAHPHLYSDGRGGSHSLSLSRPLFLLPLFLHLSIHHSRLRSGGHLAIQVSMDERVQQHFTYCITPMCQKSETVTLDTIVLASLFLSFFLSASCILHSFFLSNKATAKGQSRLSHSPNDFSVADTSHWNRYQTKLAAHSSIGLFHR